MKIMKLLISGICWGCTICVLILMIGAATVGDSFLDMGADYFIRQAIASMIVGIGFSVPTLIYDKESISRKVQTLIHMGIGFLVFFPIACYFNWIPVSFGLGAILLSVVIALVTFFIIWYGYYLYYKKEAKKMNQKLEKLS